MRLIALLFKSPKLFLVLVPLLFENRILLLERFILRLQTLYFRIRIGWYEITHHATLS